MWSFRLTSYNTLADAYTRKNLYAAVDPGVMRWDRRGPAVVERVAALGAEIACLQEVQASHWPEMQSAFAGRGWLGSYAQKGQGRPDGCAILYRPESVRLVETETLYFDDGEDGAAPSGHLALIATFDAPVGVIRVATTHLRWQAATERAEAHIGYREAVQLVERCRARPEEVAGTIVCGDFNVSLESPVLKLLEKNGFADAYAERPQGTCNPNGRVARIDYILAAGRLRATGETIPELADGTVLPSAEEPSDHLPITTGLGSKG
jgi:endonuclease/exonuclease/phosphatase family metal-dependent hydrolase